MTDQQQAEVVKAIDLNWVDSCCLLTIRNGWTRSLNVMGAALVYCTSAISPITPITLQSCKEAGIDCDVLCYDYYHIMGCPEWEDADFTGSVTDDFRPEWFRSGPGRVSKAKVVFARATIAGHSVSLRKKIRS